MSLLPSQKARVDYGDGQTHTDAHAQNLTCNTTTANLLSLRELFLNLMVFGHSPNNKLFLKGSLKK